MGRGPPQQRREGPPAQVGRVHGRADLAGEDEPLVPVEVSQALHLPYLPGEVFAQRPDRRLVEPDGAAALLRLDLTEKDAPLTHGDRPSHAHAGVLEIQVLPLEGEQLPLAHPRVDGEHVEGLEPVAAGRAEKAPRFSHRERPHLRGSRPRALRRLGHVAGSYAPLHGLVEGLVQGYVQLVHAGRREYFRPRRLRCSR